MNEPTPFDRLKPVFRGLAALWARWVALAVGVAILFGAYPPLGIIAFLLTVCLPILALILWGRGLDEELGWSDLDDGPW